ncbi:MAG: hypothetical protein IPI43_12215 [Sandaracinaceae bacterium]|nr:hypothetical protein [Sandaracinaceae bacterium]
MDGAFALYEAWVRLLRGDIDVALVFSFGRGSLGPIPDIMNLTTSRSASGSTSAAAWRALIDAGKATERDFADIAVRSRRPSNHAR